MTQSPTRSEQNEIEHRGLPMVLPEPGELHEGWLGRIMKCEKIALFIPPQILLLPSFPLFVLFVRDALALRVRLSKEMSADWKGVEQ